jgi:hypothetical protein
MSITIDFSKMYGRNRIFSLDYGQNQNFRHNLVNFGCYSFQNLTGQGLRSLSWVALNSAIKYLVKFEIVMLG